jgi:hypothetical protein
VLEFVVKADPALTISLQTAHRLLKEKEKKFFDGASDEGHFIRPGDDRFLWCGHPLFARL